MKKKDKKKKEKRKEGKAEREDRLATKEPYFWNLEETMRRLDEEFDELNRKFNRWFQWPGIEKKALMKRPDYGFGLTRKPLMDIKDTGKELVIEAEMPGIPKENIDVQLTENSIEISGEMRIEEKEEKEGYHRQERRYSTCYRHMPLPTEVLPDEADATLDNGILQIKVPKKKPTPETKSRKVKVK